MAIHIDINKGLLEEAMKLGGHTTECDAVTEALREYVQSRNQLEVIKLFGTVLYDDDYDYKKQRDCG